MNKLLSTLTIVLLFFYGIGSLNAQSNTIIDFETHDFSQFPNHITSTDYPWVISDTAHTGSYSMMSGNHNVASSVSEFETSVYFSASGSVSFYLKLGSEADYDKAYFYIDNTVKINGISGVKDWTQYSYNVSSGLHRLRWVYEKDNAADEEPDRLFIDDITLVKAAYPPTDLACTAVTSSTADFTWAVQGGATAWELSWNTVVNSHTAHVITGITSPTYHLTGLANGTVYYVSVRAKYGTNAYSNWVDDVKFVAGENAQATVLVNDGTDEFTVPFEPQYTDWYNKSEFIIPAKDLETMDDGYISKMSFYLNYNDDWTDTPPTFKVYVKETNATTLTNYLGFSSSDMVYQGTLDPTSNPVIVDFSKTIHYSGSNLLVGFYQQTVGGYTAYPAMFLGKNIDNPLPDCGESVYGKDAEALNNVVGDFYDFLPKTTFTYVPHLMPRPTHFRLVGMSSLTPTFEWKENGTATEWQISYSTSATNYSTTVTVTTNPAALIANLTKGTTYYASVRAKYGSEYSAWSNRISFVAGYYDYTIYDDGDVTSETLPVNGYYTDQYQKNEFVIPAGDLAGMNDYTITKMTFYLDVPAEDEWTGAQFSVFMKEVGYTEIDDYEGMSGATVVYNGSLSGTGATMDINLSHPYHYHGGNLLIGCYEVEHEEIYYTASFIGKEAPGASIAACSTVYDYMNPVQQNFLPKVTFKLDAMPKPTDLRLVSMSCLTPTFEWTENGNATSWQISYSTGTNANSGTKVTVTENPAEVIGNFTRGTNYNVWVRSIYGTLYSDWSDRISFQAGYYEYTVYEETDDDNEFIPVYGYYTDNYQKNEFIIPATDLTSINNYAITKMTFYLKDIAEKEWTGAHFKVFMKEVGYTEIDEYEGYDDATVVYEGSLSGTSATMDVVFSKPYPYRGGNLLIGFYETDYQNGYSPATFYGKYAPGASIAAYSTSMDYMNPVQQDFLPKITFKLDAMPAPSDLRLVLMENTIANIEWKENGTATTWQVSRRTSNGSPASGPLFTSDNTFYELTGLTHNTTYYIFVRACYPNNIYSDWTPSLKFKTGNDVLEPIFEDPDDENMYVPIEPYYLDEYQRCEFILPATEITDLVGNYITKMTFEYTWDGKDDPEPAEEPEWQGDQSSNKPKLKIYMRTVGNTSTIDEYYGDTGATTVYNTTATLSNGIMAITLSTKYLYNGGNLLIGLHHTNLTKYNGGLRFIGVYAPGASIQGHYSELNGPFPETQRNFLPQITFEYETQKTYNAFTTEGNWNVASNWSKGTIPTADEDVKILEPATIPNGYTANARLVKVFGDGTLTLNEGGQMVHLNEGVEATVKKNIAASSEWGAGVEPTDGWYTIGSPMASDLVTAGINGMVTTGDGNDFDLYQWEEPTLCWRNYKEDGAQNGFGIVPGRGYLYASQGGTTINFHGDLGVLNVGQHLTRTGSDDLSGWNLISNPFAHNIYKGVGAAIDNEKLASGFFVLTADGAWGAELGYTTPIKPCEGILVEAIQSFDLTITNTTAASSGDKASHRYITFNVANNRHRDVAYALFEDAEGLTKINHRNADIPMLYITQDDWRYAIATMSDVTPSFGLSFETPATGQYTLSAKANGEFGYLHVYDKLTGADIDMLEKGEYKFVGAPNDRADRFVVYLERSAATENDVFAYQNGDDIIISGDGTLQVFDVLGRFVTSKEVHGTETMYTSALQSGVYVLRLVGDTVKTQKIVIR